MNLASQSALKLAAFSPHWQSACPWLRILTPAEATGMRVVQCGPKTNTSIINDSDIVVILRDFPRFREAYSQIIRAARAAGKPVVYHLDDLLYDMPETHPDYLAFRTNRTAILLAIIQADLVIVTTEELLAEVSHFNKNVVKIANYLDDRTWTTLHNIKPKVQSGIVIGYMGTNSHAADIQLVADPLARILDKFRGEICFRSYGTNPGAKLLSRSDVDWIQWDIENYEEFIDQFAQEQIDVFIAPLVNNRFNQCKSSIKFIEYSARKVPGIYSALAPYSQVIVDGENGFLAKSDEDWEIRLSELIENRELRDQIGNKAQQTVKRDWLLDTAVTNWVEAYNRACQCPAHNLYLEDVVSLADQWSEEVSDCLVEAEQLRSATTNSRLWKILEKWWQFRGFVGEVNMQERVSHK